MQAKVYKMNEADWMAAYDEQSAIDWYKQEYVYNDEDIDLPLREVPLSDEMIVDWCAAEHEKISFGAAIEKWLAEGGELPYLIASTEY